MLRQERVSSGTEQAPAGARVVTLQQIAANMMNSAVELRYQFGAELRLAIRGTLKRGAAIARWFRWRAFGRPPALGAPRVYKLSRSTVLRCFAGTRCRGQTPPSRLNRQIVSSI